MLLPCCPLIWRGLGSGGEEVKLYYNVPLLWRTKPSVLLYFIHAFMHFWVILHVFLSLCFFKIQTLALTLWYHDVALFVFKQLQQTHSYDLMLFSTLRQEWKAGSHQTNYFIRTDFREWVSLTSSCLVGVKTCSISALCGTVWKRKTKGNNLYIWL